MQGSGLPDPCCISISRTFSSDQSLPMPRNRPLRSPARRILAVVLTIVASLGVAAPGASAAAKKAKCDASSGWGALAGRSPAFVAGGPTGLYLWQERGVWRVGATSDRGSATTFSATVIFDAAVSGRPVGTEGKSDIVDVRSQSVKFRFLNFGGLDGVAIESPCASNVTIQGAIDGQPLSPQQVFVGPGATNPAAMPATVSRGAPAASTTTQVATTLAIPASAASAAGATQAAPTAVAACSSAPWPAPLTGRPVFRKGPAGIYTWIEKGVLRLAFESDPGSPRLVEGRIVANGPVALRSVANERRDQVKVSGQQVSFSLRVGGGGDTFDVVAPCATSFSLEATVDGVAITPTQVYVGPSAAPAAALPLVLSRA